MSSREAFENGPGKELSLAKRNDGTYISVTTDIAWEAWKAATKRAEEVCQNEMDEQYIDSAAWYAARSCRDAIRKGNNDSC